jgi:RNA polymerase primary sigma factor
VSETEPSFSSNDDFELPIVEVDSAREDVDLEPDVQIESVLLTQDTVKDYLRKIGRVPLLNAAQEVELSKAIEVGLFAHERLDQMREVGTETTSVEMRELMELIRWGDQAKNHMLSANLRLVVSLAKRYTNHGLDFIDLIQEGNLGLIRGMEKFDYTKGFKFSTYSTWWIRQSIQRNLADKGREIRVPVHMVEIINKIARIKRELLQDFGREATEDEIAREIGVTVEKYREIESYGRMPISLNLPLGENGDLEFGDLVEDNTTQKAEEATEVDDMKRRVAKVLDSLPERERIIMRLRFGFETGEVVSLDEVGKTLGLTRERIRQIEGKVKSKLATSGELDGLRRDYL